MYATEIVEKLILSMQPQFSIVSLYLLVQKLQKNIKQTPTKDDY